MCPAFLLPSIDSNEHKIEVRDGKQSGEQRAADSPNIINGNFKTFLAGRFLPYCGPVCQ